MLVMGNLQRQIAAIRQQLATSTAETLVRFQKVEADVTEGVRDLTRRVEALEATVARGFVEMRQASEDQAKEQQAALDQLLELGAGEELELREKPSTTRGSSEARAAG